MNAANVMNIKTRGLLLVAFPLLCHLIFIIVLTMRLVEIHGYLMNETRSQTIIRNGHELNIAMINQSLDDYFFMKKKRLSHNEQEAQVMAMTHKVNEFVKLIYNDPAHAAGLRRYQNAIKNITESICEFGRWQEVRTKQRHPPNVDELFSHGPELNRALHGIIAVEQDRYTADAAAVERSVSALVAVVSIFALLNIPIAAALGIYFALTISKPLEHVKNNGKRLSNRQTLLPVIKNANEITELDSLLHKAASFLEEALQRNNELIENAADAIITLNEKGELMSINTYGLRVLASEQNNIVGLSIYDFVVPEQSFDAERFLRKTVESGNQEVFELQLRTAFDDLIDTRWSCYWSESHKKLFAVIHDISDQKRLEQLKEDFANMISHDLRSPLMAMHNALSLVVMGAKGHISEKTKADLERGLTNIEHLMQLVDDLLDFQKMKSGRLELEKEQFEIRDCAVQTAELLFGSANEKKVQIKVTEKSLKICADRKRITQLLTNLTANAIKFSPEGESVEIEYRETQGGVEISVSDRGRGIHERDRERIFDMFEQSLSSDAKEGTGLGLAICKLIVEAHGGKIWVEPADIQSETRQGSVFRAYIPERDDKPGS